jgi:hypothetical protein
MPKPKAVTEAELKAALAAIRNRKVPDISEVGRSERARIQNLSGKLVKRLQPMFAGAGFDVEKINKILADHQREVRSISEKEKSKSAKTFAALSKDLRKGIENRKKALEQLGVTRPPWDLTIVPLLTAWQIGVTPLALVDQHIEASNNWVRLLYERASDGAGEVDATFWFYWTNQTGNLAVVYSTDVDLVVNGFYEAKGNPGLFWGGESWINLLDALVVYQEKPGTQGLTTGFNLRGAHADGPDLWHAYRPGIDPEYLSSTFHLSYSSIFVPAGDFVLFGVTFKAQYGIRNGGIYLDFGKDQSKFILCPGMQLTLLTLPTSGGAA